MKQVGVLEKVLASEREKVVNICAYIPIIYSVFTSFCNQLAKERHELYLERLQFVKEKTVTNSST